ncbi:MAG: GMC family oxidoreductase, partial [Verrucomicrobiaceae bacterium]
TNWNLKKWLWLPKLGFKGIMKITFFRHVGVLSGVGVGGGSLVYANTLPVPKTPFFKSGSWNGLCDWENELQPFYEKAKKMLGVTTHPYTSKSDKVMQTLASEIGNIEGFKKTDVAVYFGKIGETVSDPYFEGNGPTRTGCNLCGGCMIGCRNNAKNTLDKNYLYLAQKLGCEIKAESEVFDIEPFDKDGSNGYCIRFKNSFSKYSKTESINTKGVVLSGGVLGTLKLLLKLKKTKLPNLSNTLGKGVRTNSESLIGVTTHDKNTSFSEGIAIGSILNIDENRHVEPVKYSEGSGFWRLTMAPMVQGKNIFIRFINLLKNVILHPVIFFRTIFVDDWSKRTQVLLYMESIESTLQIKRSKFGFNKTALELGNPPTAFNPIAQELAHKVEKIVNGKAMVMATETLFGIPSTAHILGGACMGETENFGVIDKDNKVFGYENMLICDGSMISANIGVNPSLTITAITERAMSKIENKKN